MRRPVTLVKLVDRLRFRQRTPGSPVQGCDCCAAGRAVVKAAAVAAIAILLLQWIQPPVPKPEGSRLWLALELPLLLWLGLLVFYALGESLRCLKIAPDKLVDKIFGSRRAPAASAAPGEPAAESNLGLPPSTGPSAGLMLSGAAATAVAVAVTLDIQPAVKQPDPVTVPITVAASATSLPLKLAVEVETPKPVSARIVPMVDPIDLKTTGLHELSQSIATLAKAMDEQAKAPRPVADFAKLDDSLAKLARFNEDALVRAAMLNEHTHALARALVQAKLDADFLRAYSVKTTVLEAQPPLPPAAPWPGTVQAKK